MSKSEERNIELMREEIVEYNKGKSKLHINMLLSLAVSVLGWMLAHYIGITVDENVMRSVIQIEAAILGTIGILAGIFGLLMGVYNYLELTSYNKYYMREYEEEEDE